MPVTGLIADAARSHIPVTWDALSGDQRYGDLFLQSKVDLAKHQVLGEVVGPDDEDAYDPTVVDYVGKLVAIKVIPGGTDYWASKPITDNSGQRVSASWVDRVDKLWREYDRLRAEAADDLTVVEGIVGTVVVPSTRRRPVGVTAGVNDTYRTSNPDDFDREYAVPQRVGV